MELNLAPNLSLGKLRTSPVSSEKDEKTNTADKIHIMNRKTLTSLSKTILHCIGMRSLINHIGVCVLRGK